MKKHELLKYAYDNYPKGTRFLGFLGETEFTSNGKFIFASEVLDYQNNGNNILNDPIGCIYNADNGKWAEIIPENPASILDGKVAILTENKKEYHILMDYRESKGWKTKRDWADTFNFPHTTFHVDHCNGYSEKNAKEFTEKAGYTVISFQEFAKETGIEAPVFIIKSEDGVDLYEGDKLFEASKRTTPGTIDFGKWYLVNARQIGYWDACTNKRSRWFTDTDNTKVFSSKESALKWIEEQNKPKEVQVQMNCPRHTAIISNDFIQFRIGTAESNTTYRFTPSDIEAIYTAYQSLKHD